MEKPLNRRKLKNYFIAKDLQLKVIAINFIYLVLVVLITIATLMLPLYTLLQQSPDLEIQYHAALLFVAVTEHLPLALLLVFILFFTHQIIMTHQFCGPIINFSNTFREIMGGNLSRKVQLRKHDQLQNEAAAINSMVDGLSQRIGSIKQEHAGLLLALEDIRICPGDAQEQQKAEEALCTALEQADKVRHCIEAFKLADEHQGRAS